MKKTLAILAIVVAAGIANTPTQAADRYVSGMAGVSWFRDADINPLIGEADEISGTLQFDHGFTAAAALGCDYGSTRLEAELGYQRNGLMEETDLNATIYSLMGNGYVDIPLGGGVELYGMAGVGIAQVNLDGTIPVDYVSGPRNSRVTEEIPYDVDVHETTLAWQVGAGLAIPVGKGVMLDARYRYFATTDFTFHGVAAGQIFPNTPIFTGVWEENMSISSHSVLLGLRVNI